MREKYKIRNSSSWTMAIFGGMALLMGAAGIVAPELLLRMMGIEAIERGVRASGDYTLIFIRASAMASFNMGVYYILAALRDQRGFYKLTVPFRGLTFMVFTFIGVRGIAPVGFVGIGVWELAGAVATGAALYYEKRRGFG